MLKILILEGLEGKCQRAVNSLSMERERTSALKESVKCQAAVVDRVVGEKACLQSDVSMLCIDNDRLKVKLADMELSFGEWWIDLASYVCAPS